MNDDLEGLWEKTGDGVKVHLVRLLQMSNLMSGGTRLEVGVGLADQYRHAGPEGREAGREIGLGQQRPFGRRPAPGSLALRQPTARPAAQVLPAGREPQPDGVFGRGIFVGALAPACLEGQLEGAAAPAARQAPAQTIVAPGVRQAHVDLRREGETFADGGEAVAELRLQPPVLQIAAARPGPRTVLIGREAVERGAGEQCFGTARGRPAEGLG